MRKKKNSIGLGPSRNKTKEMPSQKFVTQHNIANQAHNHSFDLRPRGLKSKKDEAKVGAMSMMNFEEIKKKLLREYQINKGLR